ncbi:hypothetical protein M011DRAFT_429950 [Sporormia fimetaria CBS 119925]|uniref:N,N-dimethylformamidase beta subunit-like C-terminal domain-containing protein n=1 Tax=Sporormia fimetaria CBS 119925 TaxID=1340428 RepID=A0A6A6V4M6_9PLEO|nr:hypothetical protein M011DRAFT_429950 [Sporormia fimetaria CBS 119925]
MDITLGANEHPDPHAEHTVEVGTKLPPAKVTEIIGYVEPWIASPGEKVDVKVSCTGSNFKYRLIRLIQGLTGPNAPPHAEEDMGVSGTSKGRFQEGYPGSYGIVESWGASTISPEDGLEVSTYVEPHLFSAGHPQVMLSTLDVERNSGFAIVLNNEGKVEVLLGNGESVDTIATDVQLRLRRWAKIELRVSGKDVAIKLNHINMLLEKAPSPSSVDKTLSKPAVLSSSSPLLFAAAFFKDQSTPSTRPTNFYNGRLDSPMIRITGPHARTLACYDFSKGISTDDIFDASRQKRHGYLVGAPTRAVKGWNWDGSEPDWTKAKFGYGAIHFHEDDLDDAGWETDFSITIPEDAVSGAYAVEVKDQDSDSQDAITFFVRPSNKSVAETKTKPRAAIILSTFTYLAYANEHMYDESKPTHMEVAGGVQVREDEDWKRMARRHDLGLSLYDAHRDLSGNVFSTAKRPILNVRPGYVHWGIHRPREFSADLLMIGYLEQKLGKGGYDVVTDHDLHLKGVAAIEQYDVVMSGCHPEYPSLESLNAYTAFAAMGGSIMYLGGNGYYWTSVTDPKRPHRIEVRRGDQGCRSFSLPAGERIHSLNGAQGGLWRSRGRTPNLLFGIGSCAFGTSDGVPYKTTEAAHTDDFSWLWTDIAKEDRELIGKKGFGGGASGDEIDRMDFDLGTPSNAVLLATSTGHDDTFGVFNEEVMFPMVNTLGTSCDKVRSDMVYYETSTGGAVFSVGSINWYGSLGWDGYKNNCAALTWNVLNEFLSRGKRGLLKA